MEIEQEISSITASDTSSEKVSAYFDCSICLDFARDPVVTLCGHLYCWPCIYKWLEFQESSVSSSERRSECPVCKAEISHESVVPLYGRGQSLSEPNLDENATSPRLIIPPRPAAFAMQAQTLSSALRQRFQSQSSLENLQDFPQPFANYGETNPPPTSATMAVCHPMCGNYGEMVYARVFGNSESLYNYPNSYQSLGCISPRMRRQEIQTSRSLNRISFFIFCCILSCLFLF